MTPFAAAMARCAGLDEDVLARRWSFRDKPMDVRYALYRTLEDAQEALVPAAAGPHPESRRVLALAQRGFGDLSGLLIGLPDDLLDKAPSQGEWSVREALRHVLWVERRYALQTLYAVERADSEPIRIPDARLPPLEQVDVSGDVATVLARIGEARAETNQRLGELAPAAMTRPTVWVSYDIDVRFRLHRFAAHITEHTVQCEKTLAALGWRATEGRRIVRRIWSLVGELEGLGELATTREIEARVVERVASI
ncbi:MAG: DinB family protein [Candidatus Rokuibacteriota bacterium]